MKRTYLKLVKRRTPLFKESIKGRKTDLSRIEKNIMILQKRVSIEKCRHWEDLQNEIYKINISLYIDLQMNKNHQNMLFFYSNDLSKHLVSKNCCLQFFPIQTLIQLIY